MLRALDAARGRTLAAVRDGCYLLGVLVSALITVAAAPVLCVPSLAHSWAERHRRNAGSLLAQGVEPRRRAAGRSLAWLTTHALVGLPAGALALLLSGCLLVTPVITGL